MTKRFVLLVECALLGRVALVSSGALLGCGTKDDEADAAMEAMVAPNVEVDDAVGVDCGVAWPREQAEAEQAVFELVNQIRMSGTECGNVALPPKPPLELNAVLVCTARLHSKDMADQGYFEHESLDGRTPFERMTNAGYEWSAAAENIAEGQPTAADVMQTWLESPDHCNNIMGDFVHLGVGHFVGERPLWTQNFGSPL
jgi:uncharacterized protein YkwD